MPHHKRAAIGAATFSTGKPCSKGHTSPRYVSTGHCVQCQLEHSAARRTPHVVVHVYPPDVPAVAQFALALAATHWPGTDLTDHVQEQGLPRPSGAVSVRVPCAPEDEREVFIAAASLRGLRERATGRALLEHVIPPMLRGATRSYRGHH
jgi:hypothetical protein